LKELVSKEWVIGGLKCGGYRAFQKLMSGSYWTKLLDFFDCDNPRAECGNENFLHPLIDFFFFFLFFYFFFFFDGRLFFFTRPVKSKRNPYCT